METTPSVQIVVNAPINQISDIIIAVPKNSFGEEAQFDLEAILVGYFDKEFDILTRKSNCGKMCEILFVPLQVLQAMTVDKIHPMCLALKVWIKQVTDLEMEVFLTFEEPPPSESELHNLKLHSRRLKSLVSRIIEKQKR